MQTEASGKGADISGYVFRNETIPAHAYMVPPLREILARHLTGSRPRVFDLGCGKGDVAAALSDRYDVAGVDPSVQGIALAHSNYPDLDLRLGSAYDDLPQSFGLFDAALSIDVIEYTAFPRMLAANMYALLQPGGIAVVTAPYHGYWKNIAIAASNSMDRHFNSLQDYGRIKFWSIRTLGVVMAQAGFRDIEFMRVGRIPPLAKSLICIGRKPAGEDWGYAPS